MLVLRKVDPQDLAILYVWENKQENWLYGDTHNPLSHKDIYDYLEQTTGDIYKDGQLRLIIELESDETANKNAAIAIGCLDLYDFDAHNRKAGVGVFLDDKFRKKGYATLALEKLKDYAFSFLRLEQLYAFVCVSNTNSIALFEKSGFLKSGTLKHWQQGTDVAVYQCFNKNERV